MKNATWGMLAIAMLAIAMSVAAPAWADDEEDGEDAAPETQDVDGGGEKDGVRIRGGFDVGGGFVTVPQADISGGSINLHGRIGVQIDHTFGVVYQATPTVLIIAGDGGIAAGATVFNNVMATFTFGHFFDVMVGPSLDVVALAGCSGAGCGAGVLVGPGANGRVAFNIGGLSGDGPRRSGFNIGLDAHPSFLIEGSDTVVLLDIIVGIGGEWY